MLADDQVLSADFSRLVCELIDDESVRTRMVQAAKAQKTADAVHILADVVMDAAKEAASALQ